MESKRNKLQPQLLVSRISEIYIYIHIYVCISKKIYIYTHNIYTYHAALVIFFATPFKVGFGATVASLRGAAPGLWIKAFDLLKSNSAPTQRG